MFSLARVDSAVRCIAPTPDRVPRRWSVERAPCRVRELGHPYDDEGSEARSLGSVSVGSGAWWAVVLSVPGAPDAPRDTVLLHIERHGALVDERQGPGAADLVLPSSEIDAVVTLLAGVVTQARRDGVLPAARS